MKNKKRLKYLFVFLFSIISIFLLGNAHSSGVSAAVTTVNVDESNFLNYFTQNGSAVNNYDETTGVQSITTGSQQSGNVAFNGAINLNYNFTINGAINLGKITSAGGYTGVADGIGFAFYQGERNQVGGTGGNLGIYGITNAFGWKLDTWYNDEAQKNTTQILDGDYDDGYTTTSGNPYGAFISTNSSGYGTIDSTTVKSISKSSIIDNSFHNIIFSYIASTKTMIITLTIDSNTTATFSKEIDYDTINPLYYFTIAASTGSLPTNQAFKITKMTYSTAQQAIINYIDDTTGKTLTSDTVIGNGGETIDYSTATQIAKYEALGYELVTDGDGFTNATAAGKVYDYDDTTDQTFDIHLKHSTSDATEKKTVKQTIHYVYALGGTAATDYTASRDFTRTNTTDNVIDTVTNGPWSPTTASFGAVTSPTISGYNADLTSVAAVSNITGSSTDIETTVTYSNGPVITKYVDEDGKEINGYPTTSQTGRSGDSYTTTPPIITGYALKTTPDNASGTYTADTITVTYVYKAIIPETITKGKVITKYVDEDGNEIATQSTQTGRIGAAYATSGKSIAGYTLDTSKLPENAEGKFTKADITVTYIYKKTTTTDPGSSNSSTGGSPTSQSSLPQTGEKASNYLILLGLTLLGFVAYVGAKRNKKVF